MRRATWLPSVGPLVLACAFSCSIADRQGAEPTTESAAAAADSATAPPEPRGGDSGTRLLAFLHTQGGALSSLTAADLDGLTAVRLDREYAPDDLRMLADLPALREVMIWRDGERFGGSEGGSAPSDADLRVLSTLHQIESLRIGGWSASFTDAGVAYVATLPRLRRLDLVEAQGITNVAMESVGSMRSLERLDITYTKISDVGLRALLRAPALRTVRFGWARESEHWLAAFRAAHPDAPFTIESP